MEKIGITDNEDILIKMTRDEFRTFKHLARAIEGNAIEIWDLRPSDSPLVLPEFSGVFGAIEAFALAQFKVNELQNVLDKFKEHLNNHDK